MSNYTSFLLPEDLVITVHAKASDKVTIWPNTQVKEIVGDKLVIGIRVQRDREEKLLLVQGVFVEIWAVPNSDVCDFVEKNRVGKIIVNCKCETSVRRLFAAGDVTNVPQRQIVVAAGEGCKAALSAFRYLSQR